jgi:hypothetical protein
VYIEGNAPSGDLLIIHAIRLVLMMQDALILLVPVILTIVGILLLG